MGSKSSGAELKFVRDKFIEWCRYPDEASRLAVGKDENGEWKVPPTIREFAERFGVRRETLWRWRKDENFQREVISGVLDVYSMGDYVLALKRLREIALESEKESVAINAIEKMFKLGGFTGKAPNDGEPELIESSGLKTMTDEELEALAKEQCGEA